MLHMSPEERRECERRNRKDLEDFLALKRRMGDISLRGALPRAPQSSVRQSLETSQAVGNILVSYALFNTAQPAAVMQAGAAWMSPSSTIPTEAALNGAPRIETHTADGGLDMLRQGQREIEAMAEYETDSLGEYTEAVSVESVEGNDGYGVDGGFAGGADASGGVGDAGGGGGWEE